MSNHHRNKRLIRKHLVARPADCLRGRNTRDHRLLPSLAELPVSGPVNADRLRADIERLSQAGHGMVYLPEKRHT